MSTDIQWKWSFYKVEDRFDVPSKVGECMSVTNCQDNSFWKEFWPRCKNAPQILYGSPTDRIIILGYKSRRPVNEQVVDVFMEEYDIDESFHAKLKGDLIILTRSDRKVDGVLLDYLVRCDGDTDDTVDLALLLDREGIETERPNSHTFAYLRNRVRMTLNDLYGDPSMSRDTERGILEQTIRETFNFTTGRTWKDPIVKHIYKTIYSRVWKNLLPSDHPESVKNPKLLSNVKSGLVKASDLASMTPQQLWPEKWCDLEESRILKQIASLEKNMDSATDMFQCRKCKERKCGYCQVQTRSADEPMTTFVWCLNCGNRWKE